MKILMVCLGNICRSPMAEGILRDKIRTAKSDIITDSCGTSNWHIGKQADERAIKTLQNKGIDISDLRARQFIPSDFEYYDLIYCMDTDNYDNILGLTNDPAHKAKVNMILNVVDPLANQPVPDPYFGNNDGFEKVYQLLDEATTKIIQKHG